MKKHELALSGEPILVVFQLRLRAHRGKLISGGGKGDAVHAATFLRERRIVLDAALLRNATERDRILAHEIAHFIWWKAGRKTRAIYSDLVGRELSSGVPGEMGWSAEWRKLQLSESAWAEGTRRFREYLCESFCDTLAGEFLSNRKHEEITLPRQARRRRSIWIQELLHSGELRI